jgi:hypothetical protein
VSGGEHTGAGLVDDADIARMNEFVAEALDEKALDVFQSLTRADDDWHPLLVKLREEMECLAWDLVVSVAGRAQRLVDVEY